MNLHGKIDKNYTTGFLLNTLDIDSKVIDFQLLTRYNFLNAYINWEECPDVHKNCLYLLFNFSKRRLEDWFLFYDIYSSQRGFVKDYDIAPLVCCVVFKIKPEYHKFPEYLLAGQFSKFGTKYSKNFVISESNNKIKCLEQYLIINKSSSLRKEIEESIGQELPEGAELASVPLYEEESLCWHNILQDLENK